VWSPFGQVHYAYSTHYLHNCAVFRGITRIKRGAKTQDIMRVIRYRSNLHGSCVKARITALAGGGSAAAGDGPREGGACEKALTLAVAPGERDDFIRATVRH